MERGNSSVQEAGEDGYGSGKVTYISGIMWIDDAKAIIATPTIPAWGVSVCLSVCLSVCPSVCSRIARGFFFRGAGA